MLQLVRTPIFDPNPLSVADLEGQFEISRACVTHSGLVLFNRVSLSSLPYVASALCAVKTENLSVRVCSFDVSSIYYENVYFDKTKRFNL